MIETLLLMLAGAVMCCVMSFAIGYLGTITGLWTAAFRSLSCIDYENLTCSTHHSDAWKPDTRR